MNHQLDLMPAEFADAAVLERIDAQLPKQRDVKTPRLPLEGTLVRADFDPAIGEVPHAFATGDIVTHSLGGGRWRVLELNAPGDLVHVECIDATDALIAREPWTHVGACEWNLTRRYSLIDDVFHVEHADAESSEEAQR